MSTKNIFFITGLPRSRTAWLANWFTYGDSFCFHEVSRKANNIVDVENVLKGAQFPSVGVADSSFVYYYKDALRLFPEARVLVVQRDAKQVASSLRKVFAGLSIAGDADKVVSDCQMQVRKMVSEIPCAQLREIPFDGLNNPVELKAATQFLVPNTVWGLGYDLRFSELKDLRIIVIDQRVLEQAGKSGMLQTIQANKNKEASAVITLNTANALKTQFEALLAEMCGTVPGAYAWLVQLRELWLTWDHIVDGDALDVAMAENVFETMLFRWPYNPFYQQWKERLAPVMMNAVLAWRYSNSGGSRSRASDVFTEIPCAVAFIIGGTSHVARYSNKIRQLAEEILKEDDRYDDTQT